MVLGNPPQNNKSLEKFCGWGPQCLICVQSAPNLKAKDSEEEDWNGDRQNTKKEDQLERSPQAHSTHHPMSSQIDYHTTTGQRKKRKIRILE